MLIKVKIIDSEGKPKGREYTYRSDIELFGGELIIADMAGMDKVLVVTQVNVPEEKVDFEIKTIKGLYTEGAEIEEAPELDIEIKEEVLPVIKINFEEMKQVLNTTLNEYKGLTVTEQSLSKCKAKQKELAGVRAKIDTYRKDKKKKLSKPITDFETQCKELISLIEEVEKPIKEGIEVFDNLKRDEKRNAALRLIKEVAEEQGLNEKYSSRLDVSEKYCNLTAKEKDVKDDLTARAMTLKVEQDREQELIDIINDVIESENERINRKMKFEDFKRYIDRGMSAKDVIAEIKLSASKIFEAENPPTPPESTQNVTPEPAAAPVMDAPKEPLFEPEEPKYYAIYRIVGKHQQLLNVSKFLKDNGINYAVTSTGEI